MKDCILSNIWINWRFDGLGDSHKAPELSGISTLEFLRNWWAERLLRFRFVTEQKRGWQGGNVPSNRFCSQRTQRDAVGCCWNVVGSDRSSLLFTILYPAVGSLRLQQSGSFDERDVQLAYKQWVAKKRAQTQWCAWVHTGTAALACFGQGADGPWVGASPNSLLCPTSALGTFDRTNSSSERDELKQ